MCRTLSRLMVPLVVFGLPAVARAADGPELTPLVDPPVPVVMPLEAPVPVGLGFYRPSRLEVWQYYAVDRSGRFRPRVALGPGGPFYLYSGAAYPYLPTRPRDFLPYVLD